MDVLVMGHHVLEKHPIRTACWQLSSGRATRYDLEGRARSRHRRCLFIGSHLVDALVAKGADVRVVDNLSSGRRENLAAHLERGAIDLVEGDLLDPGVADRALRGVGVVFHLAADHGGRGYVDLHQAACASNLLLDGIVFHACRKAGVGKVVYASSGCVYPNHLQTDVSRSLFLTEEMVGPPFDADNMYGWAKLMGATLATAGLEPETASCRYSPCMAIATREPRRAG